MIRDYSYTNSLSIFFFWIELLVINEVLNLFNLINLIYMDKVVSIRFEFVYFNNMNKSSI